MLLVGSTKGAFFFVADEERRQWQASGPHLGGWEIYALVGDARQGRQRILAGTHHRAGGATLQVSDDLGATWRPVEEGSAFAPIGEFDWDRSQWIPRESGTQREWRLNRFWQLTLGHESQPDTVYAGAEDAALFVSHDGGERWAEVSGLTAHPNHVLTHVQQGHSPHFRAGNGRSVREIWRFSQPVFPSADSPLYAGVADAGLFVSHDVGETWVEVSGLSNHPTRRFWEPAAGSVCVHSIVADPADTRRMWVGVACAGVFGSEDGGATWSVCNEGLQPAGAGHPCPSVGRCVDELTIDPRPPHPLYLQHHGGVFRSTDGAGSWVRIDAGLPSSYGFPITADRRGAI